MKFSIKDHLSKCHQIHTKLRIWLHLLKKYLMENFIFVQYKVYSQSLLSRANYFAVTVILTSPFDKAVYLKLKHIARAKAIIITSIFSKVL